MSEAQYRTLLGCCQDVTDELLVEAYVLYPTIETAKPVAKIVNAKGYNTTAEELLEDYNN